jgi:hypothetical protein
LYIALILTVDDLGTDVRVQLDILKAGGNEVYNKVKNLEMLLVQNQSGVENNYVREPPVEGAEDDRTVEEGGSILGRGVLGTTFKMRNDLDKGIYAVKRVNQVEVKLFVKEQKMDTS